MSTQSPQQREAGVNAAQSATQMNQLLGVARPELQMLMGNGISPGMFSSLLSSAGDTGMLGPDRANLASATSTLNKGYGQAGFGLGQTIGYGGLRSGEGRLSPGAMNASLGSAMTTLERQHQGALANLNFMSAQSSMTDFNKLLALMGQGSNTALGLSQGFSGVSNQALGGLKSSSEMDDIMGGIGAVVGIAGAII